MKLFYEPLVIKKNYYDVHSLFNVSKRELYSLQRARLITHLPPLFFYRLLPEGSLVVACGIKS